MDIIKRAEGPTPWVSPIVPVPKPKAADPDDIRICTDMRQANKAICCERHITPTLDELQARLNGTKVFSRIDLRSGYNQLVLHKDSWYITTFSTHIAQVINNTQSALNISDDIIVFGNTQCEHDKALLEVCISLVKNGLTANLPKCEFGMSELQYYGMIFSGDGMAPDPRRLEDLLQMAEPSSVPEVQSLVGMANYNAKFIPHYSTLMEPIRTLTHQGRK